MATYSDEGSEHLKKTERYRKRIKRYTRQSSLFKNKVTGKEDLFDDWENVEEHKNYKKKQSPSNKPFKLKKRRLREHCYSEDEDMFYLE